MKRVGMKLGLGLALVATAASASYRNTLDDDGCWDGRDSYGDDCITGSSTWNGDRFTAILKNRCANRLYVKFCNQKRNSSYHDCGASGVQGYGEKRWTTSQNATGRAKWRTTGSTISNKDWVCGSKVRGWQDKMFY